MNPPSTGGKTRAEDSAGSVNDHERKDPKARRFVAVSVNIVAVVADHPRHSVDKMEKSMTRPDAFLKIENHKLTLLPPFAHKEPVDDLGLPEDPIYSNYVKYLWKGHTKSGGVQIEPVDRQRPIRRSQYRYVNRPL
jgi:hypothetical protein